jgi:DNA-binding CsgD family transcriptional regulator
MSSQESVSAGEHMRVLLAGDDGWCETLARALATNTAIEVTGQAHDGEETLARARELEPDVVALDPHLLQFIGEHAATPSAMPVTGLTGRELEVLSLVAESKTNKQIAGQLFISQNTVKNHIRNILEKLHLHSRMEAATYAWRNRMLRTVPADQVAKEQVAVELVTSGVAAAGHWPSDREVATDEEAPTGQAAAADEEAPTGQGVGGQEVGGQEVGADRVEGDVGEPESSLDLST